MMQEETDGFKCDTQTRLAISELLPKSPSD
jgi:hypothetical protein